MDAKKSTISDCRIIDLRKISDPRGNLTPIEGGKDVPFEIKRAFWIYDVPGGEERGGHAYRKNEEFIVALSGSFDVVLDDGKGNVHIMPYTHFSSSASRNAFAGFSAGPYMSA